MYFCFAAYWRGPRLAMSQRLLTNLGKESHDFKYEYEFDRSWLKHLKQQFNSLPKLIPIRFANGFCN